MTKAKSFVNVPKQLGFGIDACIGLSYFYLYW